MRIVHVGWLMGCAVLTCLSLIEYAQAAPSFALMKDFDAEKLQKVKMWVSFRGQHLWKGSQDRCMRVSFIEGSADQQAYLHVFREVQGVTEQIKFPVEFDGSGFSYKMNGDEVVMKNAVDTDYSTYFIGYLTFKLRKDKFLFVWTNSPKPDGDLVAKVNSRLMEITGTGLDALLTVDNDNCPEPAR